MCLIYHFLHLCIQIYLIYLLLLLYYYSMSCARIRNRPVRFLDPQVKLILELRGEIKRLRDENKKLRTSMLTAPGKAVIDMISKSSVRYHCLNYHCEE